MTNFKGLTIWTIVLSFFIIIGAGHGIGCIGLIEIAAIVSPFTKSNIWTDKFSLSLTADYDNSLLASALFTLIGHILLIVSLLVKNVKIRFWTKVSGLLSLWLSFYYLTHNLLHDGLSQFSFVTGLPFLIGSLLLAYGIVRQKFDQLKNDDELR
jgi:hypothetical protein